eukprot:8254610-Ditylum_brightwellii.AAC.1
MTQYFSDIVQLTSAKKSALPEDEAQCSNTFAKYFAKHFPLDATAQQLCKNLNLDILMAK